MKIVITALLLLGIVWFVLSGCCFAGDLSLSEQLQKLPPMKQGLMYEVADSKISYLSTIELLNWKNIALEAGYSQENKIMAVVSYPLLKLKDCGVNIPIIDLIEFNIGYGVGVRELFTHDSELQHGPTLTLINIKF